MTFIEILQQGGYILPQYTDAQAMTPSGAGMAALDTMMKMDQQAFTKASQRQQLGMQGAQLNQQIIDSTIRNQLSVKSQELLREQMKVTNETAKYNLQKGLLTDVLDTVKTMHDGILTRDRDAMTAVYKDAGVDPTHTMNNLTVESVGELAINAATVKANYTKALDNRVAFENGNKLLTSADEQLKRADRLRDAGVIIPSEYIEFISSMGKAQDDVIRFENGSLDALDFNQPHWENLKGSTNFLDEAEYKAQLEMNKTTTNIQNQTALSNARVLDAQASVTEASLPFTIMALQLKNAGDAVAMAPYTAILSKYGLTLDPSNPQKFLEDIAGLTPMELEAFTADFTEQTKKADTKKISERSIDEQLAYAYSIGDTEKVNEIIELKRRINQANGKNTNGSKLGEAIVDNNGNTYRQDGTRRHYESGYITGNDGINPLFFNNPFNTGDGSKLVKVNTGAKDKGTVLVKGSSGKDNYVEYVEKNGKYYLVVKDKKVMADLTAPLQDNGFINSLEEFTNPKYTKGNYVPGIKYENDALYIPIPGFNNNSNVIFSDDGTSATLSSTAVPYNNNAPTLIAVPDASGHYPVGNFGD